LDTNSANKNISIFGLGYVGGTAALCLKKLGFDVFGVDIDPEKQKQFREKIWITDYKVALDNTEMSLICVPTPCQDNGNIDISYVETVCKQINDYKPEQIVIIRSTVFPNQIKKLESITKNLVINPEFLRESTAEYDFFNPPFIVVGSRNKEISEKVIGIYSGIVAKKYITTPEEAQMLKYVCNVWHACKIAFTNEIGTICDGYNIDGKRVMELFRQDKKLNISETYHRIGEPFGGHCLPKDLSVFMFNSDLAKNPLIHAISDSNDIRIKPNMIADDCRCIDKIKCPSDNSIILSNGNRIDIVDIKNNEELK